MAGGGDGEGCGERRRDKKEERMGGMKEAEAHRDRRACVCVKV